jgi:hypothetical protein
VPCLIKNSNIYVQVNGGIYLKNNSKCIQNNRAHRAYGSWKWKNIFIHVFFGSFGVRYLGGLNGEHERGAKREGPG